MSVSLKSCGRRQASLDETIDEAVDPAPPEVGIGIAITDHPPATRETRRCR